MEEQRNHYVYVLFRPWNAAPCYVGKGKGDRWLHHEKRTKNLHLARIIAKAGGELPKVKVREGLTDAEALTYEQAWIAAIGRGAQGPLVNLTDGGEGPVGLKHSAETRKKLSGLARARLADPAVREAISAATKAGMARTETRARTCEGQRRRFEDHEERAKNSARQIGRVTPPEVRAKIGAAHVGQKRSVEARAKMSAWQVGRVMTDEARANARAAAVARWANPEQRKAVSDFMLARNAKPENRAMLSAAGQKGAAARWKQVDEARI